MKGVAVTNARLALGLFALLALGACEKKIAESPAAQARTVSVVAVGPHEIEGSIVASGPLVPFQEMDIYPQLTIYRVQELMADEGTWVKAGQPLLKLDDTLLRAQLEQQAALAKEQNVIADRADAEAERVKGLDKEGILSQEQIDERRYAAQSARAQAIAQADAAEDMRTREGLMTVRSPEAGLVFERNVKVGDMGAGTTPWFRIARDGKIELAADVSEQDIEKIRPGMPVRVMLADQAEVMGVVRLVSPGVDTNTRLGRVRVSLPVRPDIRAGGFARANFLGISHSANAVPETAVRYDADGASVMVVGANDKVTRVPVTTGQRGGGYVELLSGPAAGSHVVERAGAMLVPGDVVRPVAS
ncbi:MAG TPA: efflux RND transporter periplasmic adaptor subunit [Caulobacteraceae bacterium]|jgi:HlyD family secretion protein